MSSSFRPQGLQHTRLPCPSPSPRVCTNSCSLSQWCHPTISSSVFPFSSCLPSFPSVRVFSDESALHIRWSKYWSFSFSISSSNEDLRLISFRKDWLDLLSVQGTLKSLLQHHSSKTSTLQHSPFFYCPSLTSVHDYWKNHTFDYANLCREWNKNMHINEPSNIAQQKLGLVLSEKECKSRKSRNTWSNRQIWP